MELRICYKCNKVIYAEKDATVVRCSFCNNILFEARFAKRIPKALDFYMVVGKKRVKARLRDYSSEGLGIDLKSVSLNKNSVIRVGIKDLNINGQARAVWIKQSGPIKTCGLKML